MDSRKDNESPENEEFPAYGEGKSSEGKPLLSDGEMQEIEYKAPEGFRYEFGYDKDHDRKGYLLVPVEKEEIPKSEDDGSPPNGEESKQWQWGDELEPSPLMVHSILSKGPQKSVITFSLLDLGDLRPKK